MIRRQSFACSYGPSGGGEPSAGIGAVPATCTRSPATTAREKPTTGSYGECPEMRRRSTRLVSRDVQALFQIDEWGAPFAAAGVTDADRTIATHGERARAVLLASVSKPVT